MIQQILFSNERHFSEHGYLTAAFTLDGSTDTMWLTINEKVVREQNDSDFIKRISGLISHESIHCILRSLNLYKENDLFDPMIVNFIRPGKKKDKNNRYWHTKGL